MKIYCSILIILFLGLNLIAQDKNTAIESINNKYEYSISNKLQYDTVKTKFKNENNTDTDITGYFEGTEIKIIEIVWDNGVDYNSTDFYFSNAKLFFAYDKNKSQKKTDTYYLQNEKLILWLDSMNNKIDLSMGTNSITGQGLIAYSYKIKDILMELHNQNTNENIPSKIETDIFPVTIEMFRKAYTRNYETVDIVDGMFFSNKEFDKLLIYEFGTDFHRYKEILISKDNISNEMLNLIPLYSKKGNTTIPATIVEKKDYFKKIESKNIIEPNYFISQKQISIGINKEYAIEIYGKPDTISNEENIEILKWLYVGDIFFKKGKENNKNKPVALNSFGYEVIMFFKKNKLIGMVLINEIP